MQVNPSKASEEIAQSVVGLKESLVKRHVACDFAGRAASKRSRIAHHRLFRW